MTIEQDIFEAIGVEPAHISPLSGGCVGVVYAVNLKDGRNCVVKTGGYGSSLDIEGRMLTYLSDHSSLPVPDVFYADDCFLIMGELPNDGRMSNVGEIESADAIASLHQVRAEQFGLEFDTLIGGLAQSNKQVDCWFDFYREERLFNMAAQAQKAGRLPTIFMSRLEKLAGKLTDIAPKPSYPALLHGDLWGGNILTSKGHLSGFIDPAIYYGHPEMDLAFSTLFNSFGQSFFDRYREHLDIAPGFFEERRDLYNLYPLLVHVRLFGGSYLGDVDRVLSRFGC